MSAPQLLNAVVDVIASIGDPFIEDRTVALSHDGKPPLKLVSFRDFFVGVGLASWEPGPENETNRGLYEVLGVECVVSKKIVNRSLASINEATFAETNDLYDRVRQVMLVVHQNHTILSIANTALAPSTWNFITPLQWRSTSIRPELQDADWLHGKGGANTCCLVARVRFGGAERIQCNAVGVG